MLYQIRSYFKFLWESTNQHGVHSPFVYGLVTRCFYDRKKGSAYELLSRYRSTLRNNRAQIEVKDLGVGSRVFSSSKRRISDMAKKAGITPKRARLLNRLVHYLEVERALELGTSLGLGTSAMAAGNKIDVQTIEGCPATAAIAEEHFRKFGLDNIKLLQGEFDAVLDKLKNKRGDETRKEEQIATSSFSVAQKAANAAAQTSIPASQGASGNGVQPLQASALEDQNLLSKEGASEEPRSEGKARVGNKEELRQTKDFENSGKAQMNLAQGTANLSNGKQASTKNLKEPSEEGLPQNIGKSVHPNPEIFRSDNTYSLVFFDGNHQKEATLRYFEKMLPLSHNNSVFIFDDIHWSREMEEAWEQIKVHPSVRVSIDTFQWGLVFFRREQAKEHFVVRV